MSIHLFRVLLIRLGKIIPFFITSIVFISYSESLYAMITNSLAEYNGEVVLYKPISWLIASYFEYDMCILVFISTLSIAIKTCIWNKLAILYLFIQLMEKDWLAHVELEITQCYIIVVANILLSLYLTTKGLKNVNSL